jgi:hypothetical protein
MESERTAGKSPERIKGKYRDPLHDLRNGVGRSQTFFQFLRVSSSPQRALWVSGKVAKGIVGETRRRIFSKTCRRDAGTKPVRTGATYSKSKRWLNLTILHDRSIKLRHPLQAIIFQNLEGGLIGSHILAPGFDDKLLNTQSQSGKTKRREPAGRPHTPGQAW